MAPSQYGAALWQKVFGGTLFGGLSLMAAFLLRVGENRLESKLDPKVFTLVMGGLLLLSIYMLVDILVHRYVITDDALEVYRPWGKQRILWSDVAKVSTSTQNSSFHRLKIPHFSGAVVSLLLLSGGASEGRFHVLRAFVAVLPFGVPSSYSCLLGC